MELQGKYNTATVFTDNVESTAISQIINLLNQEFAADSKIRIMPDVHAGAGCTIGTTMTITDKVVPNLVGVDIGCGVSVAKLKETSINFQAFDTFIRTHIPSGHDIRTIEHSYLSEISLSNLHCKNHINLERANLSLGTLGGGNHFIEVDRNQDGNLYLVCHSGSRYLGKQVAEYYQDLAYKTIQSLQSNHAEVIATLKSQGRQSEISAELKKLKKPKVDKALAYLFGKNLSDYLHDIEIVQNYAKWNRRAILSDIIEKGLKLTVTEVFSSIHNYIDTTHNILRKGAISAESGEKVIIPLNMRDGSIIALGKGNPDWNYSAPHGAVRIASRSSAKEQFTLSEFKTSMQGIWTTSVSTSTLDESPMAYKPPQEILSAIQDTVDILEIIKSVYNFKAS
jgi:RNA-splicing ligase RtcB